MKYDNNKTLTENAMAGVDITMPELPDEVDLTNEDDWKTPDQLSEAINEYLYDSYGVVPSSYGLEITLTDIDWEE